MGSTAEDEMATDGAAVRTEDEARTVSVSAPCRAKTLTAPVRTGGEALASAIAAAGFSVRAVARYVNVDERRLRNILSGLPHAPFTHELQHDMPREVRRAYLTAELAALDEEAPMSAAPVEMQALRASAVVGELSSVVVDAVADGVIDADELAQIEARALRGEGACRVVRLTAHAARARANGR